MRIKHMGASSHQRIHPYPRAARSASSRSCAPPPPPPPPVPLYINSPGITTEDGMPVGAETEAFSIADTMDYIESPVHTVLVGKVS